MSLIRWCHDIGREHAANKPLLKTVFQVQLFFPGPWELYCSSVMTISFPCIGHDAVI